MRLYNQEQKESRVKKIIRALEPVRQQKACQDTHNGNPRRRGEKRNGQKIYEEIMVKNFPNLMEDINLYIQEAQQIQKG